MALATVPQSGADATQPMADLAEISPSRAERLRIRAANICMIRFLERVAKRFNRAQAPLMALKGAALNLTIHDRPDGRPMSDLDLMIRPEHADAAATELVALGCRPGRPLVREGFFPQFHYETEFVWGRTYPVRIDLHVRPFRPLRYAQVVPPNAFWDDAETVQIGRATILVPSMEGMLIHLAAHSAIHGNVRPLWLLDIKRWADAWRDRIDWDRLLRQVREWHLTLPVRQAIEDTEQTFGQVCPPEVRECLSQQPVRWRDRLALHQAPRDADHPAAHAITDALCTPGPRFVLAYLLAMLLPDRRHMAEWYDRRHWGWLPCAHLLRLAGPVLRCVPAIRRRLGKIEVRDTSALVPGVFATRVLSAGEAIACRDGGLPAQPPNTRTQRTRPSSTPQAVQTLGKLRYVNHSCHPNAKLCGSKLRALRTIDKGEEITMDYGEHACNCRRHDRGPARHAIPA